LLPFVIAASIAGAQGRAADSLAYGHRIPVPTAVAAKRNGAVVLDGRLDEPAWRAATPITEFRQIDPNEGEKASQRTEVRFLFDDDALYIGAKMYDTEGAKGVMTRLVRRDASFDSDYLEIVLDSYHDHLSRAFFDLNPSGSKGDNIGIGTSCCDASWDPVWEGVTHIDEDGWTAEIRIPYSQLRFPRAEEQTWGLQVRRFIKRNNEQDQWSWWSKTDAGGPPRFGHLTGLHIPASTGHLELLPYAVTKSSAVATAAGDPFDTHGRPTLQAGLDLKDRLTSNLTLDATFNPDFGQVEVDPAVLNLSAFETFYAEKRPFFVEGSQVFDFGNFSCMFCSNAESMSAFYSRRVGRAPEGADLATTPNLYADVPDATTILGAAKITGRTQSGFTIGLLDALTGQANARVETLTGARATQEVEPLSNYFDARVKRDYRDGNLVVGAVASGIVRNIDTTFAPLLARHAEMYGNDLYYAWDQQTYTILAQAALTNVSGSPQEILSREESSARYLQRPDRGAGSGRFLTDRLDSTATSMRGAGLYVRGAKQTGDWLAELQTNIRTPGYETNDYAFQQRADYIWFNGNVGRQWTKPTSWYRSMFTIVGGQEQHNFEGDRTQEQLQAYWSETTPQFWQVTVFGIHRPSVVDDKALRGGPAVIAPRSEYAEFDISSDSRTKLIGNASINRYWDAAGGLSPTVSFSATYRPVSNVSVSIGPSWNAGRTPTQYVTAVADTTAKAFYGTRYVVSTLKQRTLTLDTRLNVTFSPTMTLELYMQPFFASGHYYDFKEYIAPRTTQTAVYGRDRGTIAVVRDTTGQIASYTIDPDGLGPASAFSVANPDFTEQSLRGNAVFRWEYRPGSVLYVAWTQSRLADQAFGDLEFGRDRSALLATRPDNILLVKASWWMPR
jgi:Domain of unknown function (DUF5916)/Carbohydrate family 9 binding domain-like